MKDEGDEPTQQLQLVRVYRCVGDSQSEERKTSFYFCMFVAQQPIPARMRSLLEAFHILQSGCHI